MSSLCQIWLRPGGWLPRSSTQCHSSRSFRYHASINWHSAWTRNLDNQGLRWCVCIQALKFMKRYSMFRASYNEVRVWALPYLGTNFSNWSMGALLRIYEVRVFIQWVSVLTRETKNANLFRDIDEYSVGLPKDKKCNIWLQKNIDPWEWNEISQKKKHKP